MICNTNNHDNLSNYRIDRMTEVKITGEKSRLINEIEGMKYGFNIPKHMSEHVYMFSDNVCKVKFKVKKV